MRPRIWRRGPLVWTNFSSVRGFGATDLEFSKSRTNSFTTQACMLMEIDVSEDEDVVLRYNTYLSQSSSVAVWRNSGV